MKRRSIDLTLPVRDYSNALQMAVSWLGDRHLLALPVTPLPRYRPNPGLFLQPNPWLSTHKRRC